MTLETAHRGSVPLHSGVANGAPLVGFSALQVKQRGISALSHDVVRDCTLVREAMQRVRTASLRPSVG